MRPIDADALERDLFDADWILDNDEHMVEDILRKQPTIDAVPVVHAKWIMDDIGNHRCSNCSERLPFLHCYSDETYEEWYEEIDESLYCPHCGAKMDGGKDDENA